jgi:hypothetical protein
MKRNIFFITVLLTFIASILFIATGHLAERSTQTINAELTHDEIELCKLTTTYLTTTYVDFLDFMHCCYELNKED